MKKSILKLILGVILLPVVIAACNTPTQKVENAKDRLTNAKMEQSEAKLDSIEDYDKFKIESEERISKNEKLILEYKEGIVKSKNNIKAEDKKIMDLLEQKNASMRIKVNEYKSTSKDKWSLFKTEFNHDMDELGVALNNLVTNNK